MGLATVRQRGYTIIEVLVLIAIVSLLAVMLVPTIDKALEDARAAGCQSNLTKFCIAFVQHNRDSAGIMPCALNRSPDDSPADHPFCEAATAAGREVEYADNINYWMDLLYPYHETLNQHGCPSDTEPGGRWWGSYEWNPDGAGHYRNHPERDGPIYDGVHIDWVQTPEKCAYMGDGAWTDKPVLWLNMPEADQWPRRHDGGDNFAFIDGHVEFYRFHLYHTITGNYYD